MRTRKIAILMLALSAGVAAHQPAVAEDRPEQQEVERAEQGDAEAA